MQSHILSIILFTPLAGAFLLIFIPQEQKDDMAHLAVDARDLATSMQGSGTWINPCSYAEADSIVTKTAEVLAVNTTARRLESQSSASSLVKRGSLATSHSKVRRSRRSRTELRCGWCAAARTNDGLPIRLSYASGAP